MVPARLIKVPPFDPLRPQIRLTGEVGTNMMESFFNQLDRVMNKEASDPILLELMTQDGDADIGVRIAQQIDSRANTVREIFVSLE
jgi:ATP-dependent protease ClpP protease subunit